MSRNYFTLRCGNQHEKIPYDELQYLEVMNDHILLHLQEKRLATVETLEWIMSQLPMSAFQRVHQWFVVSYRHITQLGENYLMIGNIKIPVSQEALSPLSAAMAGKVTES
ncbi:LytTR family DNA-binding domain-containing protein [Chitinophaga varians]|uniref:LytTR family DNA-binding domain-containing protein n=1 Tax=Chitinophaga varians TaxID=2202339 RepID=UPI00165FC88D|nr:LytTR family DNA-binding domain-containing protein [Chitinophaga varians]MBC9912695.1 LytTR family transcriptional regulator [Chitinophaga varians]